MSSTDADPTPVPAARPARPGRDETRQALLTAAHDLLANEGPEALTVRRIATAAGVSTMNVYSRFGGKDGVVDELFVDGFRRLGETMNQEPSDDPLADLVRCGDTYCRFARDNPTYYSLMFDRVVSDFEPSDAAKQAARAAFGRVVERVRRAMDAGAIRQDDPVRVAASLWSAGHGVAILRLRMPDPEFDWDAIERTQSEALLRGFAPD